MLTMKTLFGITCLIIYFTDYTYGVNSQQYPLQQTTTTTNHGNAEFLWPMNIFLPNVNKLGYNNWQEAQRSITDLYRSSGDDNFSII